MTTKPTYEELKRKVSSLQEEVAKRAQAEIALRRSEKALRESERMLNETQTLAKIGGWEYHVDKKRTTWTDEVYRIYGVDREAHDPNNLKLNFSFYSPEDRNIIIQAFRKAVLEGESYDLELGFISAKGEHIWVRTIGNPIEENGKVKKVVGNLMDITERKRANEMLLAERLKLERYFEHIPLMAYNFSLNGRIVDCNAEAVKALEYDSKSDLMGKAAISTLYTQGSQAKAKRIFKRWRRGERIKNEELRLLTRKGKVMDVLLNVDTVFDQAGNPIHTLATHLDITEHKRSQKEKERLQSELQRVQKSEAITTLAGGIAHDYNNLISVIMGNLSLSIEQAEPGSQLNDFLNEANAASLKARDLTHELMALSRQEIPVMEVRPLVELLYDASDSIFKESGISLKMSVQKDLWSVPYDRLTIGTVFRNVMTNALEAMPGGGTVIVKAENLRFEEMNQHLRSTLNPIDYVHISIQDQGEGIPRQHLNKIFDPYFSTKPRKDQKGMGLGLATTHAIVEKHGGHIAIDAPPGEGTTLNIYLPVETKVDVERYFTDTPPAIQSSIQRILVMDDEEMLRKLAQHMLHRLGYEVTTVKDGVEAIKAVRRQKEEGEPFHVAILDLTIKGGMGGEQTVRELLKLDPNIKTVVSSGYANDPVLSHYKEYGFTGRMAKPYEIRNLKETIKNLSN